MIDRPASTDKLPLTQRYGRYRWAIITSAIAHVILAIILFYWYWPSVRDITSVEAASGNVGASVSSQRDAPAPIQPEPVADVPPEQIARSIEAQVSQLESVPNDRKLTELEKKLKRLESVADRESLKQTTETIASSLGIDSEQYATKEAPDEGRFDTTTAQVKDVTRHPIDSGQWRYESVLVDAKGRTMTVEMDPIDGETTYKTFEQLKQFPMAQGIYQSVVMPLMQKMLEAEQVADHIAEEAKKIEAEKLEAQDRQP